MTDNLSMITKKKPGKKKKKREREETHFNKHLLAGELLRYQRVCRRHYTSSVLYAARAYSHMHKYSSTRCTTLRTIV